VKIGESLREARERLAPLYDTARLDAELLLAHVLDRSRAWLHTWPERPLSRAELERFAQLVEKRRQGVPIAYLTGYCSWASKGSPSGAVTGTKRCRENASISSSPTPPTWPKGIPICNREICASNRGLRWRREATAWMPFVCWFATGTTISAPAAGCCWSTVSTRGSRCVG